MYHTPQNLRTKDVAKGAKNARFRAPKSQPYEFQDVS